MNNKEEVENLKRMALIILDALSVYDDGAGMKDGRSLERADMVLAELNGMENGKFINAQGVAALWILNALTEMFAEATGKTVLDIVVYMREAFDAAIEGTP